MMLGLDHAGDLVLTFALGAGRFWVGIVPHVRHKAHVSSGGKMSEREKKKGGRLAIRYAVPGKEAGGEKGVAWMVVAALCRNWVA